MHQLAEEATFCCSLRIRIILHILLHHPSFYLLAPAVILTRFALFPTKSNYKPYTEKLKKLVASLEDVSTSNSKST